MSFVNGLFSPAPTANQIAAEKAERNKENAEMQAAQVNSNRKRNIAIGRSMFNAAARAKNIGNTYGSPATRNRLVASGYIPRPSSEPRITNKKNGPKTLAEEFEFNKGMGKPLNFSGNHSVQNAAAAGAAGIAGVAGGVAMNTDLDVIDNGVISNGIANNGLAGAAGAANNSLAGLANNGLAGVANNGLSGAAANENMGMHGGLRKSKSKKSKKSKSKSKKSKSKSKKSKSKKSKSKKSKKSRNVKYRIPK